MRPQIEQLSNSLGYQFRDVSSLELALTHRSAGNQNNERLEFLGDAILGFVIADYLFNELDNSAEGGLSRARASLVKRDTLADIARQIELGPFLHLGIGELKSGGQSRNSILADALEATIAAVYLDGGYEAAKQVILRLFYTRLNNLDKSLQQKDPKTRLQEYLQAKKISLPVYDIAEVKGEQHQQRFIVQCKVSDIDLKATGYGSSRRKAEQDAAEKLLHRMTHE